MASPELSWDDGGNLDGIADRAAAWLAPDEDGDALMARLAQISKPVRTSVPFLDEPNNVNGERIGIDNGNCNSAGLPKLRSGKILEVSGPSGTCKTECLLQSAATCILPESRGGWGKHAIFIDLAGGVDPLRLVQILDGRIRQGSKKEAEEATTGSEVLEQSLRRFHLSRCYTSMDLIFTLRALTSKTSKPAWTDDLRLVLIDNINAFYWIDRSFNGAIPSASVAGSHHAHAPMGSTPGDGIYGLASSGSGIVPSYTIQNVYETFASVLKRTCKAMRTTVIVTRLAKPEAAGGKRTATFDHVLPKAWQDIITYRVMLEVEPNCDGKRAKRTRMSDEGNGPSTILYSARWNEPKRDESFYFSVTDSAIQLEPKPR